MQFSSTYAFALVALTSHVGPALAQSGGYLSSCKQTSVGKTPTFWQLSGLCKNYKGEYVSADLKLGDCVGNNKGHLVFQRNGGFGKTCPTNVAYDANDGTINAGCKPGDGSGGLFYSVLDLNSIIGNSGGKLGC